MDCKKCGKTLNEGDKFCSNCGTKVERKSVLAYRKADTPAPTPQSDAGSSHRDVRTEDFNWDLDGYPTDTRKTEDVDFDWGSVVEEKQRNLFEREMRSREEESTEKHEIPVFLQSRDESSSLEEAIFADMGSLDDRSCESQDHRHSGSENFDRFFSFNQKNEELQNLLDQEYERIRNGEISDEDASSGRSGRHEEFDWTLPSDRLFGQDASASVLMPDAPVYVCTVLSQPPKGYLADLPFDAQLSQPACEAKENGDREPQSPPSEIGKDEDGQKAQKLTFDDVFGDDDDFDRKPKKKSKVLKVFVVILCILVAAEVAAVGIQYFAPDSAAGRAVDRAYEYIFSLFDKEEKEEVAPSEASATAETEELISGAEALNKNIASIEADSSLLFADGKDYGLKGFENAYTFADEPWYEDENGKTITYGEEIVGTVIQYYSSWVDKINGKNRDVLAFVDETSDVYTEIEELKAEDGLEYGISKLSIGEIRSGGAGFYVLTSVIKTDSESGDQKAQKQIVYLEPVSRAMKIVDIKEI